MPSCQTFDYKVIFSRARRSLSISVSDDGGVTVRCPSGSSPRRIESFVRSKSDWVNKHLSAINSRNDAFAEIRSGSKILIGGQPLVFVTGTKNSVSDGLVSVKNISCLKDTLINEFGDKFIARFYEISEKLGLKSHSVGFRAYKARWGCCDIACNILFNYKVLMLPPELQEYIIVHELCHTAVHNHSRAFKALLRCCLPDFRSRERELKDFSFLCRMY